jgi:hypothetical protein
MAQGGLSHLHHYVPEWYQKRFFAPGDSQLYRLDIRPERVQAPNGKSYFPTACSRRPPSRCFCTEDLYMLRFGRTETDTLERNFFGSVDRDGAWAMEVFAGLESFTPDISEAFQPLLAYMGAQRFRTPRGLDWLSQTSERDRQSVLLLLTRLFQAHGTMWTEGVWEIVSADNSATKFIISDSPITFYNPALPRSLNHYPGSEELDKVGTRTIFPLSLSRCLVITHAQFVRAPKTTPLAVRTNARSFQQAMFKFTDIQIGRTLSENEVRRINHILKQAATKYIAAGRKEWLFPEAVNAEFAWANLDRDWFLMPNPWRVPFTSKVQWGNMDGSSWSLDAYGRDPLNPKYDDRKQHDREWVSAQLAKREWAKKRGTAPRSRTMVFHDGIADKMIDDYLATLQKPKRKG